MTGSEPTLKALLKDLIDEMSRLIRQELRLAQAETAEKVSQVQTGLLSMVAGLLLAFAALLILLQALVIALAHIMPAWLASIVVGAAVAIVAFVVMKQGEANLKATNLKPERTLKSIRDDKDMVMEKVK